MQLDEAKKKEFLDHLNKRWMEGACPYCKGNNWTFDPHIYELREHEIPRLFYANDDASVIPLVAVQCGNCGVTVHVNAIIAGVYPKLEPGNE